MNSSTLISLAFQVSYGLAVFGYGLNARRDDIWYVFRRPRQLLLSIIAMFVVMPTLALALAFYLDMSPATRVALVVLAISPLPQLLRARPSSRVATLGTPTGWPSRCRCCRWSSCRPS